MISKSKMLVIPEASQGLSGTRGRRAAVAPGSRRYSPLRGLPAGMTREEDAI